MKGEGVEGRSELDFEVSEEKMWTFDDVFEDLGLKKGKQKKGGISGGNLGDTGLLKQIHTEAPDR